MSDHDPKDDEPGFEPTRIRKPETSATEPLAPLTGARPRKATGESPAARRPTAEPPLEVPLEPTLVRRPNDSGTSARPAPQLESLSFLEPTAPRKKSPEENFATEHPSVRFEPLVRAESDPLIGKMLGEYRVLAPLGQGGQGVVYRGEQPVIGRPVAIKVLKRELANDPTHARRFLDEARAVSAARHPGIIDIFTFGETPGGEPYLVMELLEGEPLDVLLQRRGSLPPKDAIALLIPMLNALSAAHAAGVIHRDLKPGNVFVVKLHDGTTFPKLLDFGLARRGEAGQRVSQTSVGGTALYIAPEQLRGEQIGPQTDLYSLGCLAYELLAGRPPFMEGNLQHLLDQHLTLAPKPLRAQAPLVSPELEKLVLQLLAKDPAARPASAVAVREQLERMRDVGIQPTRKLPSPKRPSIENAATVKLDTIRQHAPQPVAPTVASMPVLPERRSPLPFVLGGVVLLLVLAAIAFALSRPPGLEPVGEPPPPEPTPIEEPVTKPEPVTPVPEPVAKPEQPEPTAVAKPEPTVKPAPPKATRTHREVKERWRKLHQRAKTLPDDVRRMAILQLENARYCEDAPDTCWRELTEIEQTFWKK